MDKNKELDLELRDDDSEPVRRLKLLIAAQKAGKKININGFPDGKPPKRNYDDMPDDTIYASLPDGTDDD